jgi:cell division ATPase FtsA
MSFLNLEGKNNKFKLIFSIILFIVASFIVAKTLFFSSKQDTTGAISAQPSNIADAENIKINQYEISEIIYSRVKEILDLSKKQINLLTKKEISYIIITGGTTEANDFDLVVEEVFGKDASICKVKEIGCRHNKYSSVLGLIKYYHYKLAFRNKLAYTVDQNKQNEIINIKNKNSNTVLGKIYGYFFNS